MNTLLCFAIVLCACAAYGSPVPEQQTIAEIQSPEEETLEPAESHRFGRYGGWYGHGGYGNGGYGHGGYGHGYGGHGYGGHGYGGHGYGGGFGYGAGYGFGGGYGGGYGGWGWGR